MSKPKIFVNGKLRNYNEYEPNLQGRTMPLYVRIKKPIIDSYTLYYDRYIGWTSSRNCKYHFKDKKTKSPAFYSLRDGIHVKKVGEITFPTKEQHKKVLIFDYVWGHRDGHMSDEPMPNEFKAFVDVKSRLFKYVYFEENKEVYIFKKSLLAVFKDYGLKIKKTKSISENYWKSDTIKLRIEIDYTRCTDLNSFLRSLSYVSTEVQELIASKLKQKRSQGYE